MSNYFSRYASALSQIARNSVRLIAMVWSDRAKLFISIAGLFLLGSVATVLRSGVQGLLLNELPKAAQEHAFTRRLILLVALSIVVTLVPQLLVIVRDYLNRLFAFYLEQKFALAIVEKKGQLDLGVLENPKHNDLINVVTEQGGRHAQAFIDRQFSLLENVAGLIIGFSIFAVSSWWVLLMIVPAVIPELLAGMRYGTRVWGIHHGRSELRRRFTELCSHFGQAVSVAELKIFQNVPTFIGKIRAIFGRFHAEERENEREQALRVLGACAISELAMAGAFVWFLPAVVQGDLQIGTFWFLVNSVVTLRVALYGVCHNLAEQYHSSLFVSDFFRFMDLKPALPRSAAAIVLREGPAPVISFDKVTFAYPGSERPVLRDFSLTIRSGEKLGLVGVNGAGKSTFVKLLCRFYDPQCGRITVDGHDLRHIDLESWYAMLGVLGQDYCHFRFPANETIALGRSSMPFDQLRVEEAGLESEADRFIRNWPQGYDQMLGREFAGGIEPSGGQWQKLALARTLYRGPSVLVLDEPTASVDAESEARILERLSTDSDYRSVVLIAHRFSVLRKTDRICVIENGSVKELGTHNELMESEGTYSRLFSLQAAAYQASGR